MWHRAWRYFIPRCNRIKLFCVWINSFFICKLNLFITVHYFTRAQKWSSLPKRVSNFTPQFLYRIGSWWRHDTRHNYIQHNNTQLDDVQHKNKKMWHRVWRYFIPRCNPIKLFFVYKLTHFLFVSWTFL